MGLPTLTWCFYTPFGVRCLGTLRFVSDEIDSIFGTFLYALRREVLGNCEHPVQCLDCKKFLYALRREVLGNCLRSLNGYCCLGVRFYTPFGVRCLGTVVNIPA